MSPLIDIDLIPIFTKYSTGAIYIIYYIGTIRNIYPHHTLPLSCPLYRGQSCLLSLLRSYFKLSLVNLGLPGRLLFSSPLLYQSLGHLGVWDSNLPNLSTLKFIYFGEYLFKNKKLELIIQLFHYIFHCLQMWTLMRLMRNPSSPTFHRCTRCFLSPQPFTPSTTL
jgi:hypothetical protein